MADLSEVMPPHSVTLEAAPPLNIITDQLIYEGQLGMYVCITTEHVAIMMA